MRILFECFVICWKEIKTFHQKLVTVGWYRRRAGGMMEVGTEGWRWYWTRHSLALYWDWMSHWSKFRFQPRVMERAWLGRGRGAGAGAHTLLLNVPSANSWDYFSFCDIWTIFRLSEFQAGYLHQSLTTDELSLVLSWCYWLVLGTSLVLL